MNTTETSSKKTPLPDVGFAAIAKLAGPIFVANLAIMATGTIDAVMAGHLSAEDLAAVAVGSASIVMVLITLVGILQGLSPIAGHNFGARRYERIGFELTQCLWLALVLSVIGVALLIQTDFWLSFSHLEGKVADLTAAYMTGSVIGMPAVLFARAFVALNAAVSRPKVTMYVSLAMLAAKAPVNAVFMYGAFGIPAMGGAGAGYAMAVVSWLALAAYVWIWMKDPYYAAMRPKKLFWPQMKAIIEQLRLGVPIGLSTFFEVSSFTLMAIFIARIGTVPVAAHQCVANITATIYTIPLSIGIATSVLVAQSIGAGSYLNAQVVTLRALKAAMGIGLIFAVTLLTARHPLMELYSTNEAVVALGSFLLLFGGIYHVADCAQTISAFALRGYRVTLGPMLIYGTLLWAVGLGGGYWMGFYGEAFGGPYGAAGFWGMTGLGLFLAAISLTTLALWVAREKARSYSV